MTRKLFGGLVPQLHNVPLGLVPRVSPIGLPDKPVPDPRVPIPPPLHQDTTWDGTGQWNDTTGVNPDKVKSIYGEQMANWAKWAVQYGNEAHVDPDLVLGIALMEGAPVRTGYDKWEGNDTRLQDALRDPSNYHPLSPAEGDTAGLAYDEFRNHTSGMRGLISGIGNSVGLTNQKKDTFDETTQMYGSHFLDPDDDWDHLPGNDRLALKAAAFNLKKIEEGAAPQAGPTVRATPLDQFLASGYNASGLLNRSQNVAEGKSEFKDNETAYGVRALESVGIAYQILYGSGAYK
ncbi:hypothetical protein ACIP5Y_47805 [Nocardia sp. NPDC088792]|uniref:hypothetical protein n=1 Tax=Nocardia sp. NPDC088792 TaxID=3364332 RepID=UPI00381B83F4